MPSVPTHLSEAKETYIREGTKGLTLINGGGAVALLTFLQAIWNLENADKLKESVLYGIIIFAAGVAVSSAIYLARHIAFVKEHSTADKVWYQIANRWMPSVSIILFICGIGITVYGGFQSLSQHEQEVPPAVQEESQSQNNNDATSQLNTKAEEEGK